MQDDPTNVFRELSQVFIDTQNGFNKNCIDLRMKLRSLTERFVSLNEELEKNPFNANLNVMLNLELETANILESAKNLEKKRDKITIATEALKAINQAKLNG